MSSQGEGLNLVVFAGRLLAPARFSKLTGTGMVVCNFELQTIEDLRSGQKLERHPVAAFGNCAETMREIDAGTMVLIRGSMRRRKRTAGNGHQHELYEAVAFEIQIMGPILAASSEDPKGETA